MHPAHQTIIDAVIRKADAVCPDSLALIGVYGSAATGDLHEKSDLDLLILINDDNGWQLGKGFILDDADVGYDIYCTNWESLENDAKCEHAHLAKLMDSRIVYVRDPSAAERLEALRDQAAFRLASKARFETSQAAYSRAKEFFAECFLEDSIIEVRSHAGAAIHYLLDAIMLYYGAYFHKGVKRTFEELREIEREFELEVDLPAMILDVVCAESTEDIRIALKNLMWAVRFRTLPENEETKAPDASLAGTYEEMYSNWRSKMQEAAKNDDVYSSFMNLLSFEAMLDDIADQVELPFPTDIMGDFSPADLPANARLFDDALCQYREAYRQAGIEPVHYADAEAFAADYLR